MTPSASQTVSGNGAATPIYYTRCPVPTASGIAYQRAMFEAAFAGSPYRVRDLGELGEAHRDAHYTHSIERFFREGGAAPPIWARSRGVDSVLLGATFMEERLGIYVRAGDAAKGMTDLAGRRVALPAWPRLVFNFWRVAAAKGIASALEVHGMDGSDVVLVDVAEGWDPHERRGVGREDAATPARCEYRGQLGALLGGTVDAIFAKGPEAALLEREAAGAVRLLYDVRLAPERRHRVNNSTPRLLTTSRALLERDRDAVVLYLRTVLRAAAWALDAPADARSLLARECAVRDDELEACLMPGYLHALAPALDGELLESADEMKRFLLDGQFIERDFDIEEWADAEPLREARKMERVASDARGSDR